VKKSFWKKIYTAKKEPVAQTNSTTSPFPIEKNKDGKIQKVSEETYTVQKKSWKNLPYPRF
jgi:hypothetical protein